MKKIILKLVLPCCFFVAIIMIMDSCKKESATSTSIPFQGPKDPSFEIGSATWSTTGGCTGRFGILNQPAFRSGTSFMPTNGTSYASLSSSGCDCGTNSGSFYQYNVDFSNSHTITFDYEVGGLGPCTGNAASLTVTISVTGNGTKTLWTNTFTYDGSSNIQKKDMTVSLPSGLPSYDPNNGGNQNQLNIIINIIGGSNSVPSGPVTGQGPCPCVEPFFNIDNIRVQ